MLEYYITDYVAQTLQTCHQEHVGSSKNSALLEDLTLGVVTFLESPSNLGYWYILAWNFFGIEL